MSTPGFTAETSLYRTSASYHSLATGSDRLIGGVITRRGWTSIFVGEVAWLEPPGGFARRCGALGEPCCRAPFQNIPAFGPIVSCQEGLGCDITTNKCVSPCGGTGQACCDGPETRAPKWTADGKLYSPNSWNMREMCDKGACNRQTHRCFACGTEDGSPCCPPDAAQATARCIDRFLVCEYDPQGFFESGTCRACGSRGKRPCDWGCDAGLDIRNGVCDFCGGDFQPPCDSGCNHGLGLLQGLCRQCGNVGQIPCDNGCKGGLRLRNGLCAVCGAEGQPPCDGMTCQGDLHPNIDMLSNQLLCTASCGHNHQNACRTTYRVPGGVRSRYRCFNHSKLFAAGPANPSNCICVPNTSNDRENDVSDDNGFCISTFPAPGDIADPPDCDGPSCGSKHEG